MEWNGMEWNGMEWDYEAKPGPFKGPTKPLPLAGPLG